MWWFYLTLLGVVSVESLLTVSSPTRSTAHEGALFLTPILERGNVMEARKLSRVKAVGDVESYSGYLTVNKRCQSNLFFWFFPAKKYWKRSPVMLWLQGGPGVSSLFGLFEEIGPFYFDKRLKRRECSWNVGNSLLFIDQPVGTGFSFTGKGCYATNETQVGEELYSALVQFFQLFPEIKENKFILAGESYAGHYVPAIGYKIHKSNQNAEFKINLKGMMIGNGWMDKLLQGDTSEYLYQIGLLDFNTKNQPNENNNLNKGYKSYDRYNYVKLESSLKDSPFKKLLRLKQIRKLIHVGNQHYYLVNGIVNKHLINETTKIKPLVEELLEHYPIVFYNGQLDTVCPYPLLVKFLRALDWSGAADYERVPRHKWCEGGVLVGYHKSAHNLHEVMVRASGHMVPKDQPFWASRLAHSVTYNPPDNPLASLNVCKVN